MSTVARLKIKEIDRDQKKQWMVVNNSTVHENLTLENSIREFYINSEV